MFRCVVLQPFGWAGVAPTLACLDPGPAIVGSRGKEVRRSNHASADPGGFDLNICLDPGMADALSRQTPLIGEQRSKRLLEGALPGVEGAPPGVARCRCRTDTAKATRVAGTLTFRREVESALQARFGVARAMMAGALLPFGRAP